MENEFSKKKKKCLVRPHNCYNIFFILERERLLQQAIKASSDEKVENVLEGNRKMAYNLTGYDSLSLPDLPPRFQGLSLEDGWYVPGKNAHRKHVKTHGLTSFVELARTVATNWKEIDVTTKDYCETVARIIKERHALLTQTGDYEPKKKSRENTKMSNKKSKKMQRRRATMPNVESKPLSVEDFRRSSSMGDTSSPGITFITISVPSIYAPITPELAVSSYRDIANRILESNQANMHRSLSLPDFPRTITSPEYASPIISPSILEPIVPKYHVSKTCQEVNIGNSDIIGQILQGNQGISYYRSSLPNLPSTFNMEVDLPMISPVIPDDTTAKYHGSKTVQEVDISDSAIHDMWRSDIV